MQSRLGISVSLKCPELIFASTLGVFLTLMATLSMMQLSLLYTLDLLLSHYLFGVIFPTARSNILLFGGIMQNICFFGGVSFQ